MRIVVVGGGEISLALGRPLAAEHAVMLVEHDAAVVEQVAALDGHTHVGSGTCGAQNSIRSSSRQIGTANESAVRAGSPDGFLIAYIATTMSRSRSRAAAAIVLRLCGDLTRFVSAGAPIACPPRR